MTDSKRKESDLIGNILTDDGNEGMPLSSTSMQAYGYIRSTSAPPPGLNDLKQNDTQPANPLLMSPEYYNYYYSQKPLDPRLPKPLWKPGMPSQIFQEQTSESTEQTDKETQEEDTYVPTNKEQMLVSNEMGLNQNTMPAKKEQETSQKYQNQQTYQQYNQGQNFQQGYSKPKNTFNYSGGQQQQQPTQFSQPYNQFPMQYGGQQQGGFMQPGMQMGMGMNTFAKPFYQPNYQFQQPMYGGFQPPMQNQMGYQPMPNMYGQNFQVGGPNPYMFQGNMGGQQKFPSAPTKSYQQKFQYNQNQFNTGGNMQGKRSNQNFYNQDTGFKSGGGKNFQKGGSGGNFRKNQGQSNAPKLDINEVMQRIVENCQDQNGSRMIQQHFETASSEDRDLIFEKVLPESLKLAKNVFGNYVIQKILEKGTKEQKHELFKTFEGEIYNLTIDVYGCRVIQKALEEFKNDFSIQQKIIAELKDSILECIESENGNHVIQKMFGIIPHEHLDFIIKTAVNNLKTLPFHPYGCRVIQKILETEPETKVVPIIEKLIENCVKLFEDQYGNYIMQYILEKGPAVQKNILFKIIKDNFITLSFNKFASNVTEKSVIFGTMDFRREVLSVLLSYNGNPNEQPLFRLMNHEYGNYVIQRLFECGDDTVKVKMYERIKTYDFNEIRRNQYGKHVLSFIEKQMDDNQKF